MYNLKWPQNWRPSSLSVIRLWYSRTLCLYLYFLSHTFNFLSVYYILFYLSFYINLSIHFFIYQSLYFLFKPVPSRRHISQCFPSSLCFNLTKKLVPLFLATESGSNRCVAAALSRLPTVGSVGCRNKVIGCPTDLRSRGGKGEGVGVVGVAGWVT